LIVAAALTLTPASGSIVHAKTQVRVDVTGASSNDASGDEIRLRIIGTHAGTDDLVSHEFAVSHDGKHSWYGPTFPVAGTWVLTLTDTSDDSSVATANAVVS
jgi:hypothetical protein